KGCYRLIKSCPLSFQLPKNIVCVHGPAFYQNGLKEHASHDRGGRTRAARGLVRLKGIYWSLPTATAAVPDFGRKMLGISGSRSMALKRCTSSMTCANSCRYCSACRCSSCATACCCVVGGKSD